MPGANYMGGKRNAAKARVKDTTGRLERSFFGQRRLCAASQAMGRNKIPLEENMGGAANISLGHAKRKIPPNNDVITSSFIPSPIDVSPSTPHSRRHTKKRLEAHSSNPNVGRSQVLDTLDISEPMFLRQVLNRILTMPDLAGISRYRTKPTVIEERQASDESSPLQRTKRKRSMSDLYVTSDSLSDDYNMESTGIETHDDGSSEFADVIQENVRSSTLSSRACRYSTSPKRPSSNYTSHSNLNLREITGWKESCPTSIVFRGLKNSSAKQSMMATYPVEEPTVYGTLFEQADPWDTIGQILGLPNTKPSKNPREATTKEREEDLMSTGNILELQYPPLIERQSTACESQKLDRQEELDRHEEAENAGTALNEQEIAQLSEAGLSLADIEDEHLFIDKEYESPLAIPELEELDGLFIGPSLFELDKDEDEI